MNSIAQVVSSSENFIPSTSGISSPEESSFIEFEIDSGLTHKFRYAQDLSLLVSVSFQKYSLRYGVTPFFVPSRN